MGEEPAESDSQVRFPETLQSLTFESKRYAGWEQLKLPDGLTHLNFLHLDFKMIVKLVTLPRNLRQLYCQDTLISSEPHVE